MVKRIALLLLPLTLLARPALAQDFAQFEISFGYGNFNYGTESTEVFGQTISVDGGRVHGFAMHTSINLVSWLGFENYTGAYALPDDVFGDVTMITNTFGAKLIARDVVGAFLTPYVAGGFGVGYFTSNQSGRGFSTAAARYAGGVDFNLNESMAIRLDVGNLALSSGFLTDAWRSNLNVTTGIVFKMGY